MGEVSLEEVVDFSVVLVVILHQMLLQRMFLVDHQDQEVAYLVVVAQATPYLGVQQINLQAIQRQFLVEVTRLLHLEVPRLLLGLVRFHLVVAMYRRKVLE